jgi:hypothetical protein
MPAAVERKSGVGFVSNVPIVMAEKAEGSWNLLRLEQESKNG